MNNNSKINQCPLCSSSHSLFVQSVSDSKWKKSHSHLKNSYHICKRCGMTYLKKNINYNDIYTNPYWDDKDSNDPPIDYMRLGFLRGIHILKELKKLKIFPKNILDIGSGPRAVSFGIFKS